MMHLLIAGDINRLKEVVADVISKELEESMKMEVKYCKQRIEIIEMQDA